MRILYVTYDGLTDPIGQSQILPYLAGCAGRGHDITVISFEKADRMAQDGKRVREQCDAQHIDWLPQRFHAKPPILSKGHDLWAMKRSVRRAIRTLDSFDLLHARSYQAGWVGLEIKRASGLPLLFDMRGFWVDQRREGGRWSDAHPIGRFLYRQWKNREAQMVREADHMVVLTEAARNEIMNWPCYGGQPISVIPCCADFELFAPAGATDAVAIKSELGFGPDDPVLAYLGSTGTVYRYDAHLMLYDRIRTRDPRARLLHIGSDSADYIIRMAADLGIRLSPGDLVVRHAARGEVGRLLSAADVGTAFCADRFSSKGVSPTKVGEYLACGVPVISNDAVGDSAALLHELGCGHSLPDFSEAALDEAAEQFFHWRGTDRLALRQRAQSMFDLKLAIKGYGMVYDSLAPLRLPEG